MNRTTANLRRIFLMHLAISIFGLCNPCVAQDKQEAKPVLRIATFQADVTPPVGSPLSYGFVRPVERIVDPLSARGVILLTEEKPIVLCVVDWVAISNGAHDAWREALAGAVGTRPGSPTPLAPKGPSSSPGSTTTASTGITSMAVSIW